MSKLEYERILLLISHHSVFIFFVYMFANSIYLCINYFFLKGDVTVIAGLKPCFFFFLNLERM